MHSYDRALAEDERRAKQETLEAVLAQLTLAPHRLDLLRTTARHLAVYRWLFGAPAPEIRADLRLAAHAGAELLRLADGRAGPVTIALPEREPVTAARNDLGPADAHAGVWFEAWLCAQLIDDRPLLGRLCPPTPDEPGLIRPALLQRLREPSPDAGAYAYELIDLEYRLTRYGSVDLELLAAALRSSDPELLEPALVDHALFFASPQLELLHAIAKADGEAVRAVALRHLEYHAQHWSAPARREEPDGFMAWHIAALLALARRRGLAFELESDYLPGPLGPSDHPREGPGHGGS